MRVKTTNTIFGVIVLLMLLLIIKILCYWQIKEHFYNTNDVVRIADEIATTPTTYATEQDVSTNSGYIEIPVIQTCTPTPTSFGEISVNKINTYNDDVDSIEFNNNVLVNGTLNARNIKIKNNEVFTYDANTNTLTF
jgi:hypothetical protein